MALTTEDIYFYISNGLFGGTTAQGTITTKKWVTRIISHGLIDAAFMPVAGAINVLRIIGSGFKRLIG